MKKDFYKNGKNQSEHIGTPAQKDAITNSRGFSLATACITILIIGLAAVFTFQNIACGINGSKEFECSRTYPKCDMNATRVKGVCQCNKGYYGNGTSCTACSDGKTTAKWGQTTASACTYPYGLSFQIMAIVPASNTQCSSATAKDSNDDAYCYLTSGQETSEVISKYNLQYQVNSSYYDHWGGAMKYCKDRGWKLPDAAQLIEMATVIGYPNANCTSSTYGGQPDYSSCQNDTLITSNQLYQDMLAKYKVNYPSATGASVWSSVPYGTDGAYYRVFAPNGTRYYCRRYYQDTAVCVR